MTSTTPNIRQYNARTFEDAPEVPHEVELELTGVVPQELQGTLYRIGPGRFNTGGFAAGHIFDGDGLVSKFVIDGGAVRFQSRYVRTPKFRAQEAGRGAEVRGLYTQARGLRHNAGQFAADSANTHAVVHAERLLALSDIGHAWDIDLDDLTTKGVCDFNGRLPRLSRFSAHPKIDPVTGELFNFGLDLAPRLGMHIPAGLRCYRVDPSGRLTTIGVVPLEDVIVQHDFAITENYLVFALSPITVDPIKGALALAGFGTIGDAAEYRPEKGMKIVLVPRNGGRQRVIECDPLVYFHVGNAYEDSGDIVLDLVQHQSSEFLSSALKTFRDGVLPLAACPTRLRITSRGRVLRDDIEMVACEFPTHDERRTGREHRFTYLTEFADGSSVIAKVDHLTGELRQHAFESSTTAGEPIFVPRSDNAAEDDGWVLVLTYNAAEHRTALHIVDAARIEDEPVAIARLTGHFYPGFHGSFTPRVAGSKAASQK
ncbi:carotenoid oxygenase family protein [Smaragdicoccus niigatensis]|uniref:carotenoid oxygenase family protein n=1 Tax=Smaragdicoccus niigatensis TaxID=359359 RepID=UPI000374A9E8|nr:carotenoid oxygenase family protein [Smaragdicoccus niigatensis]